MSRADDRADEPMAVTELAVGTRRTLAGDGSVERSLSVRCPRREGATSVATCLACADCEGLVRGREGDLLLCTAVGEGAYAPLEVADRVSLEEVMTRDPICVRDDVSAESVAALLIDLGITGAPVVNERGQPIGMVSRSDLVQLELSQVQGGSGYLDDDGGERRRDARLPGRAKVRDFMMPIAFTLPEKASIAHAAALMVYENVHRIPVVSTDGSVVGLVAALDVLRWVAVNAGFALPGRRGSGADQPR